MNCEETQELVHAYLDRELDLVRSLEVERHLNDCRACSEDYASLRALSSAIAGVYQRPSALLQKRINVVIRNESKREMRPRLTPRRWMSIAASLALVMAVSWGIVRFSTRPSPDEVLTREVVSNHVRSLMANHLADVPSSDQHTVKPWFNGKVNFSPTVLDLGEEGFSLVGGRLDYLDGRAVAALVYQRRKHLINLFIWPSAGESDRRPQTAMLQGYNVIRWSQSDMNYWAVSDLSTTELTEFVDLAKGKYSPHAP